MYDVWPRNGSNRVFSHISDAQAGQDETEPRDLKSPSLHWLDFVRLSVNHALRAPPSQHGHRKFESTSILSYRSTENAGPQTRDPIWRLMRVFGLDTAGCRAVMSYISGPAFLSSPACCIWCRLDEPYTTILLIMTRCCDASDHHRCKKLFFTFLTFFIFRTFLK